MDALDLAVFIEEEACKRYKQFAAQLGQRFTGDAASVFAQMARNEAKHGQELATRRQSLFGDSPIRVSLRGLFDVEAPEHFAPRFNMSALRSFEVALSSEQTAFEFYDHTLAHVADPEIQALFTELRDEETEHVRMVQEAIANLPPSATRDLEVDEDDAPAL